MSSEVEFRGRKLAEDDELLQKNVQLPNFRRLPNWTSLIEATAQRKRMKKKEEMMKRRRPGLVGFIITCCKLGFIVIFRKLKLPEMKEE